MKLCMIGTGYVGLVSGVCFADLGNDVICVDKDINKIKTKSAARKKLTTPCQILIIRVENLVS